jgi:hypothetical protein
MMTKSIEEFKSNMATTEDLHKLLAVKDRRIELLEGALGEALTCTHFQDDMDEWREEAHEALKDKDNE